MDPLTIVAAAALWLFAPRPKVFTPKPDMQAIAAAKAQVDDAKAKQNEAEAKLARMQASLDENAAKEKSREREIIGYAQTNNSAASNALRRVPVEHQTAEVILAAEMVDRTGDSLGLILGTMTPAQLDAVNRLVDRLLSKQADERAAARRDLAAMDAKLSEAAQERTRLATERDMLKVQNDATKAEALAAKADRDAADTKLERANEKAVGLVNQLRGEDGFFWRVIFYIVLGWLWFTRVLPALAKNFAWAKCLDSFNRFVFHLLTGHEVP